MGENGYLFRVLVKGGKKGDYAIAVDARKFALRNNVRRVNGTYKLDFEQIRVEVTFLPHLQGKTLVQRIEEGKNRYCKMLLRLRMVYFAWPM